MKEVMEKIEKIKKVTGNKDISLSLEDLEKDFDPNDYDEMMQVKLIIRRHSCY